LETCRNDGGNAGTTCIGIIALEGDEAPLSRVWEVFKCVRSKLTSNTIVKSTVEDWWNKLNIGLLTIAALLNPKRKKVEYPIADYDLKIGESWLKTKIQVNAEFTNTWISLKSFVAKEGNIECWKAAELDNISQISWWKQNGIYWPLLEKWALKILSIPASSAAAERNWKTWSSIHTEQRNRLSNEKVQKLVSIQWNNNAIKNLS
jgi:hypothetical protein